MSQVDFFRRGNGARDVRLMAAEGDVDASPTERLSIVVLLLNDPDADVRGQARATLDRLPREAVATFLAAAEPFIVAAVPDDLRARFDLPVAAAAPVAAADAEPTAARVPAESVEAAQAPEPAATLAVEPAAAPESAAADDLDPELVEEGEVNRESLLQKLAKMSFSEKLKIAAKGSREARSVLIRDPSKMIAMAVLTSPKLTEPEVASFARMGNVSEDVLRTIGANRAWMKNYGVILALTKNSKTPLALSLNLMQRLNDRDLSALSTDRNVPEPLRVAARKKVVSAVSR